MGLDDTPFESEAGYRNLVEASPDAIILTDLQTQILMCNSQAAALRGTGSAETLIGHNAFEFIAPEDHERAMENAQKTLETGSVHSIEFTLVKEDGSRFPAELSASLIADDEGKPQAFTAVVRDISERKRAEEALQRQTALYETLLRAQSDLGEAVAILQSDGRFSYVNDAMCEMYGYSREELLTMPSSLDLVSPDLVPLLRDRFARRLSGEPVPEHYELVSVTKSGRRVDNEISIKRLGSEESGQFVVLVRDITEKKRLETDLRRSEKLGSLGVMAAGVAHHINNILARVLGQADLLLETTQQEDARRRLEIIVQAAEDGAAAVDRIKAFAYEQPTEKHEQIDLTAVVRDVIAATEPRWTKSAHGEGATIEVVTTLAEPVPVVGSPPDLREAIANVLSNAVDALSARGGRISIELTQRDRHAALRVADTGMGMSDEVLERAFDPFFTTKAPAHGTGLGLAVTYGIVRRHGGSIEMRSQEGRGTTVELFLPSARST